MEELRIMIAIAASLLLAVVTGGQSAQQIGVGKPFPGLTLPSLADGSPMSVASFRGHKLVLHVFASW